MSSEFAIQLQHISKCYMLYDQPQDRLKQAIFPRMQRLTGRRPRSYCREFWALRDVSFDVRKGESVGIIGRNGSGKSTLLQIVCGTLSPSSGTVATSGRVAALLELGSGFNGEFTGRENVYVNGAILGLSAPEIEERFHDIVAFADIGDFIDQPVKTYSSGMIMRLAFSVIAHVDADVLVIDEALSVGDAFFVQKCMRFLRRFMERGTVLFVSHDTGAVVNLCQRAVWLDNGQLKAVGSPKDISDAYLQEFFESQQGPRAAYEAPSSGPVASSPSPRDMRLDLINGTPHRNDIQLFEFRQDASGFGKGGATITGVTLADDVARPLSWVTGGELVTLRIRAIANTSLSSPIVGFYLRDRHGQYLFGDNTFISTRSAPLQLVSGREFEARFHFRMPILPVGDYSFCVAVAEGTQAEHVQHHWMHDALFIKSHASSVSTGLIGIPMSAIELGLC